MEMKIDREEHSESCSNRERERRVESDFQFSLQKI